MCGDAFQKKRTYDFGGIWTPDLFCSDITDKTLSYSVSADWDLTRTSFFVYKGSIPYTVIKSTSTAHTKTKSISMLTPKPSDLRPAFKNQVNFDHPHKNQVYRLHKKQVNFGPHTVNFDPPHKKQVNFDSNTKTKSNSIPHTKNRLISTPELKSSQFDPHSISKSFPMPRHKNQVNFDPHAKAKYFSTPT